MSFSLDGLKPQIVDVVVEAYGDDITIPVRPLSYAEYNNVGFDLAPPDPKDYEGRELGTDGKTKAVPVSDNNPDYVKARTQYLEELQMRRLAIALEGGGAKELQNKPINKQVELVREMDAGIAQALVLWLEREARGRRGSRFQSVPEDSS